METPLHECVFTAITAALLPYQVQTALPLWPLDISLSYWSNSSLRNELEFRVLE
jgi:hypothetical protein